MTISNSNGRLIIHSSMEVFDKLPKGIREALRNADHNWSGEQLYRHYRRKHPKVRTTKLAVEFIREQDIAKHREESAAPDSYIMPEQR